MDDFFNSEDYLDIIIPNLELPETIEPPEEKRIIDDDLGVFYYKRDNQAPLTDQSYPYVVIPRCLGLLGIKDVQAAGIPQVRQTLGLTGKGVLVGLVDTGIDKSASFLRDEFGKTKLMAIWDQTKGTDAYDEILSGGGVEGNSRYVSEEGYGNDENGQISGQKNTRYTDKISVTVCFRLELSVLRKLFDFKIIFKLFKRFFQI